MDLQAFSEANRTRCESPEGFNQPIVSWSMNDWFTAAMGELGEAANVAKKLRRSEDGIKGNKEPDSVLLMKLAEEIGDTLIYLDLLAQRAGLDLSYCVMTSFNNKSAEIGYHSIFDGYTIKPR